MKTKNVRISGVQVLTHFLPTFGCTIESRTNSTTASSAFMKPDGIEPVLPQVAPDGPA